MRYTEYKVKIFSNDQLRTLAVCLNYYEDSSSVFLCDKNRWWSEEEDEQ
jgi:hypothetical protein